MGVPVGNHCVADEQQRPFARARCEGDLRTRTATPATPFHSGTYFTVLWIPRGWGVVFGGSVWESKTYRYESIGLRRNPRNTKSLKRNNKAFKEILIVPSMFPRFCFDVQDSAFVKSTHTPNRAVGFQAQISRHGWQADHRTFPRNGSQYVSESEAN
jgi:hypothetical protein